MKVPRSVITLGPLVVGLGLVAVWLFASGAFPPSTQQGTFEEPIPIPPRASLRSFEEPTPSAPRASLRSLCRNGVSHCSLSQGVGDAGLVANLARGKSTELLTLGSHNCSWLRFFVWSPDNPAGKAYTVRLEVAGNATRSIVLGQHIARMEVDLNGRPFKLSARSSRDISLVFFGDTCHG